MKFSAVIAIAASVAVASVAASPAPAATPAPYAPKLDARQQSSLDLDSLTAGLSGLSDLSGLESLSVPSVSGIDPNAFGSFTNIAQLTSDYPGLLSTARSLYSANPAFVTSIIGAQSSLLADRVGSSSAAAQINSINSILSASAPAGSGGSSGNGGSGDGAIAIGASSVGMTAVSFLAVGAGALLVLGAL